MGIESSNISIPRLEAKATSLREVPKPPLVGSLKTWILEDILNSDSIIIFKGAQSLCIAEENFIPSLWLRIAIPWSPIVPFIIIKSPTLALVVETNLPCGIIPIPEVLINILSAAPFSTTLVSPVIIFTPVFLAY
ncbi:MAG: hypothetical protein DDT23_00635 [candidate division WS2 bacterium]|nr:hypothetical protein [Candidatus Lithacetigena glycinireducens]